MSPTRLAPLGRFALGLCTLGFTALISALSAGDCSADVVRIDGSSTVYPISEAVAEDFQRLQGHAVRVTVGISGTGGGFKKFCRGEIDIADASRPITAEERAKCEAAGIHFMELPVAFDALTVVVNPANTFLKQVRLDDLRRLWQPQAQGKVLRWRQVNPAWPDTPVHLYGPGPDSGTFEYFTEAVMGKRKSSRGDFTASEDDNVLVQGVARDAHALGYLGYAYFVANQGRMRAVPVVNPRRQEAVLPNQASVVSGAYQPLSRPLFLYVSEASLARPGVRAFVRYYLQSAPTLVREVGYVPLPTASYSRHEARVAQGRTGSAYADNAGFGLSIRSMLPAGAER